MAKTVLIFIVAVVAPAGLAGAATTNPTRAQIQTAIKHAEAATTLWATVNICNSKRYPDIMGIRAEIPALGFASWLSLSIQVNYYSQAKKSFEPSPSAKAKQLVRLGRSVTGLEQGGATFSFTPNTGPFNATVTFEWWRSGKLLGQTVRQTTTGHPAADFGSPPRYSAKQCLIP